MKILNYPITPLSLLENNQNLSVKMLAQLAIKTDYLDETGNTLLHLAIQSGHVYLAKQLIEQLPKIPRIQVSKNPEEPVEYLTEVHVNSKNNQGRTALALAIERGDISLVEQLIEKTPWIKSKFSRLFAFALKKKQSDIAQWLVENAFESPNQKQMFFTKKARVGKVKKWSMGENQFTPENQFYMMKLAIEAKDKQVVRLLIKKGFAIKDDEQNILHCAVKCDDRSNPNFLSYVFELLKEQNIATSDLVDSFSKNISTPLWYAVYNDHLEAVKILLENGASVDVISSDKQFPTALSCAVESSNLEMVLCLVAFGSDIHSKNHIKKDPLDEVKLSLWGTGIHLLNNDLVEAIKADKTVEFYFQNKSLYFSCKEDGKVTFIGPIRSKKDRENLLVGYQKKTEVLKYLLSQKIDTDNPIKSFRRPLSVETQQMCDELMEEAFNLLFKKTQENIPTEDNSAMNLWGTVKQTFGF